MLFLLFNLLFFAQVICSALFPKAYLHGSSINESRRQLEMPDFLQPYYNGNNHLSNKNRLVLNDPLMRQQLSRFRTKTVFDKIIQCALRVTPLKNFHEPIVKGYSFTPIDMIQSKLLRIPRDCGQFNFVPIMPTGLIKMIVMALAQERQMKIALSMVTSMEDQIKGREHGLVFEEFHAMWYLAMKSHQTRNTFLKNARYPVDPIDILKAQNCALFGEEGVSGRNFLINSLPKCTLIDLYNTVEPHCSNSEKLLEPLLLFARYSIEETEIDNSHWRNLITKNSFDLIGNQQLLRLIMGQTLLRNIDRGAGYDYVEVNWLITSNKRGQDELVLSFDFIEMKYSNPLSNVKLSVGDILQKYKLVKATYQRLLEERLTKMGIKIGTKFRLIICSWRPLKSCIAIEKLFPNILVYDLEKLSAAYGPSLINQGPFISNRNKGLVNL